MYKRKTKLSPIPVSYTHLDVYKRQELGHRDSKHPANLLNGIYRKLAASAARDAKRRVGDVSALT